MFAAENSSVSESENLYSNYEQVTQIAIPDENGNLRFYTGIEAQKEQSMAVIGEFPQYLLMERVQNNLWKYLCQQAFLGT